MWVSLKDGKGNGTPLQYSCLENPMDGGAWWAVVHGVTKSRTRLSDFTFTFHFNAFLKEMATHSSVLAWRIPGTGEPGGLPSMRSHRFRHDWSDLAAAAASRKWLLDSWSHLILQRQKKPKTPQTKETPYQKTQKTATSRRHFNLFLPKGARITRVFRSLFSRVLPFQHHQHLPAVSDSSVEGAISGESDYLLPCLPSDWDAIVPIRLTDLSLRRLGQRRMECVDPAFFSQ